MSKIGPKEAQQRQMREDFMKRVAKAAKATTDIPAELQRIDEMPDHSSEPEPVKSRPAAAETTAGTPVSQRPPKRRPISLAWKDGNAVGRFALYRCNDNGDGTFHLVVSNADGEITLPPEQSIARVAGQANEHETMLRDKGAPAYKAPIVKQEKPEMKKATKKAKAKKPKAKAAKAKAKATKPAAGGVKPGSKKAEVVKLLQRPAGCTSKEVCEATGWAAVSIPPIARSAGIALATEQQGREVRYWDKATKPKAD